MFLQSPSRYCHPLYKRYINLEISIDDTSCHSYYPPLPFPMCVSHALYQSGLKMEIILHMISISHHGLWCRCILQRREYRTLARKSLRTSDIPDQLKPTTRKRKKIKKSSASVPRGIRGIFYCFQSSMISFAILLTVFNTTLMLV